MPTVHLVNIAPSDALRDDEGNAVHNGAIGVLHQAQDGVRSGKPIPRDPTATAPTMLGPRLTTFSVVNGPGAVFDGKVMVNRKLSAADQARGIVHDWAMHSDCALPAFVLPASPSKEDEALAQAVLERFQAKKPTEADAEAYGKAFQVAGSSESQRAFDFKQSAVALTPKLWLPGDEGHDIAPAELIQLLAAQQAEDWDEVLKHIPGPTNLIVAAGVDQTGAIINSQFMGLSANTSTPSGSDTTMTGEILTSGGGLVPQSVTYSHTNGTGTFVDSATFTANGSDSLSVVVAQMNLRTASAGGGTMRAKEQLSSTVTLSSSGDAVTVTYTLTSTAS